MKEKNSLKTGLACFSFNTNTAPTAPRNKPVAYVHPSDGTQDWVSPSQGESDGTHTWRPVRVVMELPLLTHP